MNITILPIFNDNYCYILEGDGEVAAVDPADADAVARYLDKKNLSLSYILNTHHHYDHVGGNEALKKKYGTQIIGPEAERARIPVMDKGVREGDVFTLCGQEFRVLETPGHTTGHIVFYAGGENSLFCGDTLFSMGCGRLFEGTPTQMWESLEKIMALPDETKIYCGHEYTLVNAAFCLSVEPDNADLQKREIEARQQRANGKPTLPSTLATEKKINVFLRAGSPERFGELRTMKDTA